MSTPSKNKGFHEGRLSTIYHCPEVSFSNVREACEVALVVWFFLQAPFPGTAPLTQSEIAYRKSH